MKMRRVEKGVVFAYILIMESHPNIFRHVEESIISFPYHMDSEIYILAVADIWSGKKK